MQQIKTVRINLRLSDREAEIFKAAVNALQEQHAGLGVSPSQAVVLMAKEKLAEKD